MIEELYSKPEFDLSLDIINQFSKNERIFRPLIDIVSENNAPKKEIKVFELNLTSDLMFEEINGFLSTFAVYPIDVDYTLAVKSIDGLSEEYKNKSFKLCEWNPNTSVFPTDIMAIDLFVFRDGIELWDLKLEEQLQEMYDSLNSKGFLLSVFRSELTEPELALNQMNGRKYVNNSGFDQRIENFIKYAQKIGFTFICRKNVSIGWSAILWRKIVDKDIVKQFDYEKQILNITYDYNNWFELLRNKLKNIIEESDSSRLWLIANDSSINGIIGLTNSLRLEPGGDKIRCIFDFDKCLKLPLNSSENAIISDILINDLAINVIKGGKLGTYRHLNVDKNYDKIQTNDYFLNVGLIRDLSSLQWFDSKKLIKSQKFIDLDNRCIDQCRCDVYISGLNFRDVLLASGKIISGPESLFTDCLIGFEFAGRRSDTKERICGFNISRCIATSVDARLDLITSIPNHWSMEDAVTVLTTYSTVWYGLIERAQLRQNESILIHSGAGGVGQAAIAVCQYYNCHIFTTVGNEEKKRFLIEKYNIPENMIFNSRDIQFKYQIMNATNGKGVNLVLNSLTGEKLEASLKCVSDNGRFVEIGKYDLLLNKKLGMFAFLRNISFIGISVDRVMYLIPDFAHKFFDWMHENSNNGCIKPINKTVYKPTEAEMAFRYMTTGKHIGKIVFKIRDEEKEKNPKEFNSSMKLTANVKTYFDSNKVYIITGGLGGVGLELVNWMVGLNARKFVLTSRQGIQNKFQKLILDRLVSLGKQFRMFETEIIVSKNDCLSVESTRHVLEEAISLGPIGGVFHLSLVLNDCLLENQSVEQFTSTYASKVNAAIHLDQLTRDLNIDLDYFVVFSSVSCGKGNGGQTNYSFANSVVERVCEVRRADGLHGLAIQWGPIGDVGVMADIEINSSLSAIVKQRVNSCLEVLDKFLQCSQPILSSTVRSQQTVRLSTREARIIGQIWCALGVDPKTTPDHLTLGEIGIESMFAVELQQGLDRDYNIKVSLTDIKSITVREIKDFESGKIEELRKFAEEVRVARDKLTKVKFIIPTDTHCRLNSHTTGKPIYFLPPIEGIFSALESLAKKIDRPVIGLNWTQNLNNFKSIKEICSYYMNVMNDLTPNASFDIIGSSYGAILAVQMIRKPTISRAVIIDVMSNTRLEEDMITDDYILGFIIKLFSQNMPKNLTERIIRDLNCVKTFDEKLNKISNELKEFGGKNLVTKDLDQILRDSFKRAKMFTLYRLKMMKKFKHFKHKLEKKYLQMTGKLFVIKPLEDINNQNTFDAINQINESFFLPQNVLNDKLKIEMFCANPEDLSMQCYDKMSQLINQYLLSK